MNIYSVNNQPPMRLIKNNGKGRDIFCLGFIYQKHGIGNSSWNYVCSHRKAEKCYASISVNVGPDGPLEPLVATHLKIEHTHLAINPNKIPESEFLDELKQIILDNPYTGVQQLFDRTVDNYVRNHRDVDFLQDFVHYKTVLNRVRKGDAAPRAASIGEIDLSESAKLTSGGERFLLLDNQKNPNRILAFSSDLGIKILSGSTHYHGDGTFRTAAKYFGQLYVLHAYYPDLDKWVDSDTVWRKRMFPCLWAFMKRRRMKDYEQIWTALQAQAFKLKYFITFSKNVYFKF
jgi:hypothetical protein